MKQLSISTAAVVAMTGVLVMAWQAPGTPTASTRLAQLSQNQGQTPETSVNPVTPTPGAPSRTAIPEKIGEPVQSGAATPPAENLGRDTPPTRDLELKPSQGVIPPSREAPPPRG